MQRRTNIKDNKKTCAQYMADKWGFFEGSYMLDVGIEPGNWRIVAAQGGWFSEVTFTILGPPVVLEP